jgi:MoxR-like ATPase
VIPPELKDLPEGRVTPLPSTGRFGRAAHLWSARERDALVAAIASRRPLLVQGDPGTGKTQLARAAAAVLGWRLHSVAIHSRYEPTELMARFDAVRRLADAQAQVRPAPGQTQQDFDRRYWEPGPLWLAYGWDSAQGYGSRIGAEPEATPNGHVLLLDEVDKAEPELPNLLLEVLAQRSFRIDALGLDVGCGGTDDGNASRAPAPLVIVTSNRERELPTPFVRRFMVLNMPNVAGERNRLLALAAAHFGSESGGSDTRLAPGIAEAAAERLLEQRRQAEEQGTYLPGPAEYLDLLHALASIAPRDGVAQADWLARTERYAFAKGLQADDGASAGPAADDGRLPDAS